MRDTIFFQGTKKHNFYERLMKIPGIYLLIQESYNGY